MGYLRLVQFSYMEIGNFPGDFISLNEIRNFDTLILDSGNFHYDFVYMFDRVSSFLHQDTQFSSWFYDMNKIDNFYQVDILQFSGTL